MMSKTMTMRITMKSLLSFALVTAVSATAFGQTSMRGRAGGALPTGYWPAEKSQPLVEKTQTVRLAHLTAGVKSVRK